MRRLPLQTALFLGLLLSLSPSMQGAALGNASLQGNYFFVLEKIDTSPALGYFFTTAVGTLSFDGNGKVTAQGFINRNSNLQNLSTSGTYSLDAKGNVQVSLSGVPLAVNGSVSFDLNSLIASNVGSPNSQRQEILLAAKPPSPPFTEALLDGKYFLSERTFAAAGSSPYSIGNAVGTITFDGKGNYALEWTSNQDGLISSQSASGTYGVVPDDGRVLLNLPGRNSPVSVGLSADASLAVGATLNSNSRDTHNLLVLTKAEGGGLGNAGLNGSYQMVVSAFDRSQGLATTAGQAHLYGNGTAIYQLAQNQMGTLKPAAGQGTYLVDGSGNLQFNAAPNLPGLLQGGLGRSGYGWVAAAVQDISLYNFLVAILTPSQPNAVANAASFSGNSALSPGALFSIFGLNLGRQAIPEPSFVPCPGTGTPICLPLQMSGAAVKIGGLDAPLYSVSPFQINAQVPFELPPGPTKITVTLDGVESGPLDATVNAAGPGIFTMSRDGTGAGIFLHANYSLVTNSAPAHPGEVILIYATGLGAVLPQATTGAAPPSNPLFNVQSTLAVEIGGKPSDWSFAGLASGFVGLYQINVTIPPDTAAGNVPVIVTAAGVRSNTVTIPVSP